MRIIGIQMEVKDGSFNENVSTVIRYSKILRSLEPDIIVLPELWCCGYMEKYDEKLSRLALNVMSRMSKETGGVVIGSIPWKDGNVTYNRAIVVSKGDLLAYYDKIHLFKPFNEDKLFTKGKNLSMFKYMDTWIGLAICYDLRFPEMFRSYSINGAKMIIVPSAWGKPRLHQWRSIVVSEASINQIFVVAVNRVGSSSLGEEFAGHSMIVDPWGEIITESGSGENMVVGDIDFSIIEKVRNRLPILEDYSLNEREKVYEVVKKFG